MKSLFYLFLSLTILSCKKDDDNYTTLRNNIVGEWMVNHSVQEIRADTVYGESGFQFEITFHADGTGTRNSIFGIDIIFDWYYQFEPEIFVLVSKQAGFIFEDTQAYTVLKNEFSEQIWTYEVRDSNFIADLYKNTWVMEKL